MSLQSVIEKRKLTIQIISIHDKAAASLEEVDLKVAGRKQQFWLGRDLPFPILLDKDDATAKRYGVRGRPTTLLIDPEGKLIGRYFTVAEMEKHLPKIPDEDYMAMLLETTPNWGFEGRAKALDSMKGLAESFGFSIELDAGVEAIAAQVVPLHQGPGVSLAGIFQAHLEPLGLGFEVRGRGIRIRKSTPLPSKSARATYSEKRLAKVLDAHDPNVMQRYRGELRNLLAKLSEWTVDENFIADPLSIMRGRLDLKAQVAFDGQGKTLRESLSQAIAPLGLVVEVKNEAIHVTAKELKRN